MWHAATGEFLLELKGHADGVTSVAFSADSRVVTGSSDHTLRILNIADGARPLRHGGSVMSAAFDATGSRIIMARIWDAATGTMLRELLHSGQVDEASYSSDNALTLTRSETRVRVWDAVTGDMRGELRDDGGIFGARFAADGSNRRISDRSSKGVRIWDAATGAAVRLIADPGGSL